MPILVQKSTNTRKNLDVKLKNGPFYKKNKPPPLKQIEQFGFKFGNIKISVKKICSCRKIDKYRKKFVQYNLVKLPFPIHKSANFGQKIVQDKINFGREIENCPFLLKKNSNCGQII